MRWFRRKKKDESEIAEEKEQEAVPSTEISTSSPPGDEPSLPRSTLMEITNPVEAFIQRLEGIISDPDITANTKAMKDTRLQLIAGGEPILLSKKGVQPLGLSLERSIQTDVFIHLSEEAAGQLAITTTLPEFQKQYKQMVGARGAASFVTIKLHTPLEELRDKGYFSVEFLRILIDA